MPEKRLERTRKAYAGNVPDAIVNAYVANWPKMGSERLQAHADCPLSLWNIANASCGKCGITATEIYSMK